MNKCRNCGKDTVLKAAKSGLCMKCAAKLGRCVYCDKIHYKSSGKRNFESICEHCTPIEAKRKWLLYLKRQRMARFYFQLAQLFDAGSFQVISLGQ